MNTFKLRFTSEDGAHVFDAKLHHLARDLNQGFVDYRSATGNLNGYIELWHHRHGWSQMYVNGSYPIVSNPLALDFEVVAFGLLDSYVVLNERSSPEELVHIKQRDRGHLRLVT